MNNVTLHRHKDGSLAIEHAPEIFICSRDSLEMMVAGHNQAIAATNDARSEIRDLHHKLDQSRGFHQGLVERNHVTEQTITRLNDALSKASVIYDVATAQRDDAQNQAHNANLRADRAKRERDAIGTELDAARTLAGELIAAIRINAMRETFATATPEQVYEWLKPYILRLNSAGEP